jgi:hypothetical protein
MDREITHRTMKKEDYMKKIIAMSFAAILMATTLYAQDLKSVSFDDYLKSFDYKERKNMRFFGTLRGSKIC